MSTQSSTMQKLREIGDILFTPVSFRIVYALVHYKAFSFEKATTFGAIARTVHGNPRFIRQKLEELKQIGIVDIHETSIGVTFVWLNMENNITKKLVELIQEIAKLVQS